MGRRWRSASCGKRRACIYSRRRRSRRGDGRRRGGRGPAEVTTSRAWLLLASRFDRWVGDGRAEQRTICCSTTPLLCRSGVYRGMHSRCRFVLRRSIEDQKSDLPIHHCVRSLIYSEDVPRSRNDSFIDRERIDNFIGQLACLHGWYPNCKAGHVKQGRRDRLLFISFPFTGKKRALLITE